MTIQRWVTIVAIIFLSLIALQMYGQDIHKVTVLLLNTLLGCGIITVGASFSQWCYTHINFTKNDTDKKTLGYIYLGCALVYFGYVVGGYKLLFIE